MRQQERERETSYRVYVTDALRCITENTARLGGGMYLRHRYADLAGLTPTDTRTETDVLAHIRDKLAAL